MGRARRSRGLGCSSCSQGSGPGGPSPRCPKPPKPGHKDPENPSHSLGALFAQGLTGEKEARMIREARKLAKGLFWNIKGDAPRLVGPTWHPV